MSGSATLARRFSDDRIALTWTPSGVTTGDTLKCLAFELDAGVEQLVDYDAVRVVAWETGDTRSAGNPFQPAPAL